MYQIFIDWAAGIRLHGRGAVAKWLRYTCLPLDHGVKPYFCGHNHDSSYDTSTGLVPGSRLESDLSKLWELVLQSN